VLSQKLFVVKGYWLIIIEGTPISRPMVCGGENQTVIRYILSVLAWPVIQIVPYNMFITDNFHRFARIRHNIYRMRGTSR